MRVAIIYNEPEKTQPGEHWLRRSGSRWAIKEEIRDASEYGVLGEVRLIAKALDDGGYDTTIFAADDPAELSSFLATERPDAVFNCCESFLGRSSLEMSVAALYELFEIPYTGSSALTLGTALNKGLTKSLLLAHGIPTAPHCVISQITDLKSAAIPSFPLIVKPMCEDASIGIDSNAVVEGEVALRKQVRFVLNEFKQPAIVEEYIDGRELNVSLLAASPQEFMTLPISEILFDGLPEGAPRIVSYEAKWVQESEFYRATVANCPAELDPGVAAHARQIAVAAARTIGIRDYGRVDMRLRPSDSALFVLEVNPNPDLNDDAGFLRAARVTGRTYESTVREILERALERHALRRPKARRRAATR